MATTQESWGTFTLAWSCSWGSEARPTGLGVSQAPWESSPSNVKGQL